jgi:hypothetical protein
VDFCLRFEMTDYCNPEEVFTAFMLQLQDFEFTTATFRSVHRSLGQLPPYGFHIPQVFEPVDAGGIAYTPAKCLALMPLGCSRWHSDPDPSLDRLTFVTLGSQNAKVMISKPVDLSANESRECDSNEDLENDSNGDVIWLAEAGSVRALATCSAQNIDYKPYKPLLSDDAYKKTDLEPIVAEKMIQFVQAEAGLDRLGVHVSTGHHPRQG